FVFVSYVCFFIFLFFFFFYFFVVRRVLLSFPTRRSSDLSLIIFCLLIDIFQLQTIISYKSRQIFIDLFPLFKQVNSFIICFSFQDRKSTRLNSSHVSISYAVFCLKKKKLIYCIVYNIYNN